MRIPQTWLITDTHFGHKNIITYCNRPFQSVEEMDMTIIKNWNQLVMPEDLVFHLGDIAMGYKASKVAEIVRSLNGKKILLLGNHDHYKKEHWWMTVGGFDFAAKGIEYRGVWLTHHPANSLPPTSWLNVHGHLHNLAADDPGFSNNKDDPDYKEGHQGGDKPFNKLLSIENEGYKPVHWDSWVGQKPNGI